LGERCGRYEPGCEHLPAVTTTVASVRSRARRTRPSVRYVELLSASRRVARRIPRPQQLTCKLERRARFPRDSPRADASRRLLAGQAAGATRSQHSPPGLTVPRQSPRRVTVPPDRLEGIGKDCFVDFTQTKTGQTAFLYHVTKS